MTEIRPVSPMRSRWDRREARPPEGHPTQAQDVRAPQPEASPMGGLMGEFLGSEDFNGHGQGSRTEGARRPASSSREWCDAQCRRPAATRSSPWWTVSTGTRRRRWPARSMALPDDPAAEQQGQQGGHQDEPHRCGDRRNPRRPRGHTRPPRLRCVNHRAPVAAVHPSARRITAPRGCHPWTQSIVSAPSTPIATLVATDRTTARSRSSMSRKPMTVTPGTHKRKAVPRKSQVGVHVGDCEHAHSDRQGHGESRCTRSVGSPPRYLHTTGRYARRRPGRRRLEP